MITKSVSPRDIWASVRSTQPLVHNITNHVVMNWTANVLLAFGASPAMVHAPEEVEDFVSISRSLVINIGTLDATFVDGMMRAAKQARQVGLPWVLDPVGVGATRYRQMTCAALIELGPSVIRGNAGEIMALAAMAGAQSSGQSRGVDSLSASDAAIDSATHLARTSGAVIAVTGATDYVVDGDSVTAIAGGHLFSQRVTGTGCAATALVGACLAVAPARDASVAGLTALKRAAELAAPRPADDIMGPGTFAVRLVDALAAPLDA